MGQNRNIVSKYSQNILKLVENTEKKWKFGSDDFQLQKGPFFRFRVHFLGCKIPGTRTLAKC